MNFTIDAQSAAGWALLAAAIVALAALVSALLIVVLHPLLQRYALARPNARSSHKIPTPQGGGIAVVAATIAAAGVSLYFFAAAGWTVTPLWLTFAAVVLIAGVGAVDDIRTIEIMPRLALQAIAVAAVLYALPEHVRVVTAAPFWLERILLFVGGLWFVNLVNFMDGIDWMTVVEVVPLTAAVAAIGVFGGLPVQAVAVALALCGAMAGFAYFNRPIAKLFLGDVGSLPIGLLLGWLLLLVATSGHLTAAIVMPLYYVADATVTLVRRFTRGEPIAQAHRTHFYQLATDRGFTVTQVVTRVFVVNVGLCALAILSVTVAGIASKIVALVGGVAIVAGLLVAFARGKPRKSPQ